MKGETKPETQFAEIESTADPVDTSVIFHVINDVLGFVLYMHQQIPNILQDMTLQYQMLRDEYTDMEVVREQGQLNLKGGSAIQTSLKKVAGKTFRDDI